MAHYSSDRISPTANASLTESVRGLRETPSSVSGRVDQPLAFNDHGEPQQGGIHPEPRSVPAGQRFARSGLYSNPAAEDMTKSPKERFDALLASNPASVARGREDSAAGTRATPADYAGKGRTPSKDSTGSGVSSTALPVSRSPKMSLSASSRETVEDVDPATLIANAGSPEAAILTLLKEKRTTASRNDQLWKLVEKQRTMVLGLNKDLERALKEKERYKRKLKEAAIPPSPLPGADLAATSNGNDLDKSATAEDTTVELAANTTIVNPAEKTRKGPPTPLNLAKSNKSQILSDVEDRSEPATEDGMPTNVSPELDRGRRRTREDDDRQREASAIEEEQRSRSSKKSKSKSKQPEAAAQVSVGAPTAVEAPKAAIGLPTSPREPLLNGIQSPVQSEVARIGFRTLPSHDGFAPLKSPGLPMSPRPMDRPANAPVPRGSDQVDSIPFSPRSGISGLPLSPRAPRQPIPLPSNGAYTYKTCMTTDESGEGTIYTGLVSEQYPSLLLPPNALPIVDVQIESSRLRPSRQPTGQSTEEPVFTLAISSRTDGTQLWRVEKTIEALPPFDQSLRQHCALNVKLPDRNLFQGHSPAKLDVRRAALNTYFETVLDSPMDTSAAVIVCKFLSADVIGPRRERTSVGSAVETGSNSFQSSIQRKEGYLAKKGKQFGGWKARYFVLEAAELRHYESPGGAHLGSIKLFNAQIAKQTAQDTAEDAEYRHGFMILEPKRKDSSSLVRHVLCAESDRERDEWVEALMLHVSTAVSAPSPLQSLNYNDAVAADAPVLGGVPLSPGGRSTGSANTSPTATSFPQIPPAQGNKSGRGELKKIFGLKRSSEDSARPVRPVFGMPLIDAAETYPPYGINVAIPAPVYRCIEYLHAKGASGEEGIFRLSGSNVEIKALKERFNAEGDVKLLDGQHRDVHAVASLLKLYLRELPESVLTRLLHLDFLKVMELEDKLQKVQAVNRLVHRLPEANLELLAMLSRFLVDTVQNSSTSKMNVRNVGIVIAPTLNIPAPLISLFISDYTSIFGSAVDVDDSAVDADASPATPDDIRSPRKQLFTDLPTPAPTQSSFASGFVPLQAAHRPAQSLAQVSESGFGSLNAALARVPHSQAVLVDSGARAPQSHSQGVLVDARGVRGDNGLLSPGMPLSPTSNFM